MEVREQRNQFCGLPWWWFAKVVYHSVELVYGGYHGSVFEYGWFACNILGMTSSDSIARPNWPSIPGGSCKPPVPIACTKGQSLGGDLREANKESRSSRFHGCTYDFHTCLVFGDLSRQSSTNMEPTRAAELDGPNWEAQSGSVAAIGPVLWTGRGSGEFSRGVAAQNARSGECPPAAKAGLSVP